MTIEDPKDIHRLGLSVELLKLPKWVYCAQRVCMFAQQDSTHDSRNLNGSFLWETISRVLRDEVSTFHILVRGCSVGAQQEHKISEWTNSISSQVPFTVGYCYARTSDTLKREISKSSTYSLSHFSPKNQSQSGHILWSCISALMPKKNLPTLVYTP